MADVRIDPALTDAFLNDPAGPVGVFLSEAAAYVSAVAYAKAPVMRGRNYWSSRSNSVRPPGTTKNSVHPHGPAFASDLGGIRLYSSANALADPAIFLEYPARQLHKEYPFLTTGLWALSGWL